MKARNRNLGRAGVAMLAVLCAGAAAGAAQAAMPSAEDLLSSQRPAFYSLERYSEGYWSSAALVLARNPGEWRAAMARLEAEGAFLVLPAPAAPKVDWGHYAVLLVAAGEGAYESVEVCRVARAGGSLVVRVTAEPVGSHYGQYAPYHLVAVERSLLPMVTRLEAEYTCPGGVPSSSMTAEVPSGYGDDAGAPVELAASWAGVKDLYR